MVDPVSSSGGPASGLPLALMVAAMPRATRAQSAQTADSQPLDRSAAEAAQELNGHLQQTGSDIRFQMDAGSGHTFFKLVRESTGEVLLQMPSPEALGMMRRLRESARRAEPSGRLVDKEG
jgi:uncharacterized FlaG/YvyC family protein